LNLKKEFSPTTPNPACSKTRCAWCSSNSKFAELAAKSADDKMINALRKSWQKMTEPARAEALKLNFGPREKALLERALNGYAMTMDLGGPGQQLT
jgi:hypothetical protein